MDGSLVGRSLIMGTSGSFDSICGEQDRRGLYTLTNERSCFAIGSVLEIEKEIGTNTKDGALGNAGASRFVFKDDTSNVDGIRV